MSQYRRPARDTPNPTSFRASFYLIFNDSLYHSISYHHKSNQIPKLNFDTIQKNPHSITCPAAFFTKVTSLEK
jgi:hypothetical protein